MKRRAVLFALCVIVALLSYVDAATVTTVSVTSSTAGTQIVAAPNTTGGCTVTVPAAAAVPVHVARLNGTCSTALTAVNGVRITAGNGYDFISQEDGWGRQLCGILESGSTAVTVNVNCW